MDSRNHAEKFLQTLPSTDAISLSEVIETQVGFPSNVNLAVIATPSPTNLSKVPVSNKRFTGNPISSAGKMVLLQQDGAPAAMESNN